MKTLIELFDNEPVKNIIASCIFKPENVVFVCDNNFNNEKSKDAVIKLLKNKGIQSDVHFYNVDSQNPEKISEVFSDIYEKYDDIVFELTGGRELVLIGAGIFCKHYNIPCFYFDLANNSIIEIIKGGINKRVEIPKFSVKDILFSFGASLERTDHYAPQVTDTEMIEDILKVFDVFKSNTTKWSTFISFMQRAMKYSREEETMVSTFKTILLNTESTVEYDFEIFKKLKEIGILTILDIGDFKLKFKFKNKILKSLFKSQGVWLELYVYINALKSKYFDDVQMSVVIDWDGEYNPFYNTTNEIDVILTKGIKSVFISCKIAEPNPLTLSEIKLLSAKFGGIMAKSVVVTATEVTKINRALALRAKELDVELIELSDLNEEKIQSKLKSMV